MRTGPFIALASLAVIVACGSFSEAPRDDAATKPTPNAPSAEAGAPDASGLTPPACSRSPVCGGVVTPVTFVLPAEGYTDDNTKVEVVESGGCGSAELRATCIEGATESKGYRRVVLDPFPRKMHVRQTVTGTTPFVDTTDDPKMKFGCGVFAEDTGGIKLEARFELNRDFEIDGDGASLGPDLTGLEFPEPRPSAGPHVLDLDVELLRPDDAIAHWRMRVVGAMDGKPPQTLDIAITPDPAGEHGLHKGELRCGVLELRTKDSARCNLVVSDVTLETCK